MKLIDLSHIALEYQNLGGLLASQPESIQSLLVEHVKEILSALEQVGSIFHLELPEKVVSEGGEPLLIPRSFRKLSVRKSFRHPSHLDLRNYLIRELRKLEQAPRPGPALYARLLEYALANQLVHHSIPDGQPVSYHPEQSDDIPSIPVEQLENQLAHASRFFLPRWVAFGATNQLLVGSLAEALQIIDSLKNAFNLIEAAEAFLPCVVADNTYQVKRSGLLGQLVNQGFSLARFQTLQIIERIHLRAGLGELDRGLRLNLPYFEISDLSMHLYKVNIIPPGLTPFIPAFVVRAMQLAAWQVQRDPKLNTSTRRHLLAQLACIEDSFNNYLK